MKRTLDASRRQWLKGAAGYSLALPFLQSLATKTAFGQTTVAAPKRFVAMLNEHGGLAESSMFPAMGTLTDKANLFPDHEIGWGALKATRSGADAVVAPVLRAPADLFSDRLIGKMNVLHGLDVPVYMGHRRGHYLGNYAAVLELKEPYTSNLRPTIDQVMAYSPGFYPQLDGIRERVMIAPGAQASWNYSNPTARTGSVMNVRGPDDSLQMFDRIFVPAGAPPPMQRRHVVDYVLESYNNLKNANRRLSAGDKQRLDDHMERMSELERKLTSKPVASCMARPRPPRAAGYAYVDESEFTTLVNLWLDVFIAAFTCDTSRIGILPLVDLRQLLSYAGDWHQQVAHQYNTDAAQEKILMAYQRAFSRVIVPFAQKLDAIEEHPGSSYLDNTLIMWTQEAGWETHTSVSVPVVTFGSAGGFLKTGRFVDYRRKNSPLSAYKGTGTNQALGLLYSQWMATALQAMNVPPSDFERWGHKGYGWPEFGTEGWLPPFSKHYQSTSSRYFQMASDVLPQLKA
ncbi:MAG: DUF1552 domain-containing protein [Deltaproteobacteria bacterium]|nr:DUF1552 domain-containing protein [Deltaproteobacteria bacterium]